ncbi:DNA replication/repair protein RecF [Acholeplasma equirhinis]|uniref:DNA replication/repair protein RecF n=1 Tax=Acholeplasma equirhinis TaxID=555393 RepID=UPI00197AEC92|nr:DNA replication and repair protein RecF [Acholeplasma equirhinis]MBN3491052.1 DNA replication/repair protein RecF [Acholeplasma equirhinis]
MIEKIEIKNFRSLEQFQFNTTKPVILLEGPNGVGKTSVLEAIYFAATTKSHRTSTEKDMIEHDKPYAMVRLKTSDAQHEIILSEKGKRTLINKVEIKKISDYIGKLHLVMFAPEDLLLVKGSPSERRYFMDLEMMQVSKEYLRWLNHYKKILKQRNALLKKLKVDDDYTFLNILAEQLYEVGEKIYDARETFLAEINTYLKASNLKYKDFLVEIRYEPNLTKEAWLKYLKTKQKQDILYEQTTTGIHKDDFEVLFNGHPAKDYASQGTQRLITIEIKLALLEWIKEKTKKDVVLLLDDVLSELDSERQEQFLTSISNAHQTFISSAIPLNTKLDLQKVILSKEKQDGSK